VTLVEQFLDGYPITIPIGTVFGGITLGSISYNLPPP
jgi:hypothetical protein